MWNLPFPRIRPAGEHDCVRIGALHVTAWREAYGGLLPAELLAGLDPGRRADQWRRHLAGDDELAGLWVGEDAAGAPVGFVATGAPQDGALGWDAEIHALYVLGSTQRQGLGRRLLEIAAAHLADQGAGTLGLWVPRDNAPGRAFYGGTGGRPVGERVEPIGGRSMVEVAYLWVDLARNRSVDD
jgi:ribosomal protein S18 acetylase RimI-like enzyme